MRACVSRPHDVRSTGGYLYYFGLSVCFAVGDSVWESFPPAILQNPAMFHVRRCVRCCVLRVGCGEPHVVQADADRSAAMSNYKMWQSFGFVAAFLIGIAVKNMSDAAQLQTQVWILWWLWSACAVCEV